MTSFGSFWMPQSLLASFVFASTATFIGLLSVLLSERFLTPKFESTRVKKVENHSLSPLPDE